MSRSPGGHPHWAFGSLKGLRRLGKALSRVGTWFAGGKNCRLGSEERRPREPSVLLSSR